MAIVRCPTCEKPFESDESTTLPFCSERCRLVDLGRWLREAYGVPYERRDEAEPPPSDS